MTMIACTMNVAAPVIIGDLLISGSVKPNKFIIPVLTEDVLQYLSSAPELHPTRLDQKVCIIKSNVCIAFAGKVYYIKRFLEDISVFCKANDSINAEKIKHFLDQNEQDDSWKHFSFLILVVDKEDNHLRVGRFLHGDWVRVKSNVFGEVFASGSGAIDFLKETKEDVKIRSQFPPEDISYTLQVNIIMICRLLARERLSLYSVRQHWGAGFEMIYFDGDHFTKLDDITYIINQGTFNNNGDISEVPIPGIILHYKYYDEILVITVIKPYKGETEVTDTAYILRSKEFGITQFIVVPINHKGTESFEEFAKNPSFTSTRNAMGYIIETTTGHYLPASFNTSIELQVKYDHPDTLTITMFKGINDILIAEAKAVFPNLNRS